MKTLSQIVLTFVIGVSATQALTVEETFDYTAGLSLNGQNGGTGWDGTWTGNSSAQIENPSLDFPGSPEEGNKAVLSYNGGTYTISRDLEAAINWTNASEASLSFLFNLSGDDAETGIRFTGLSLFSGGASGTEEIFFGKPGNTTDIGFEKYAGGDSVQGVDVDFTTSTVFLFQADFTLAEEESTVTIILSDNSGPSGTVLAVWSNLSLGEEFSFDNIRLIRDFALDSGITAEYDEIRVSSVPEPSTGILLIMGGLAAALAGRKARR